MFAVASPSALPAAPIEPAAIRNFLTGTPQRRLVKSLLDMRSRELQEVEKLYKEYEQAKRTVSETQVSLDAHKAELAVIRRSRVYRLALRLKEFLMPFRQERNQPLNGRLDP
jgi:hypothetical protein